MTQAVFKLNGYGEPICPECGGGKVRGVVDERYNGVWLWGDEDTLDYDTHDMRHYDSYLVKVQCKDCDFELNLEKGDSYEIARED